MIRTKGQMREYITADFARQNMKHPLLARLTYGEHDRTRRYLSILRHLEYHKNNIHRGAWHKMAYAYYLLLHRKLSLRWSIFIMPNTTSKGLLLPHPGFIRVGINCHIGENCTILPLVLMGKKAPGIDGTIVIGDNCYVSTGVSIIGPVTIGNNVTIAAGAVVINDVPDNCVVAGVPAKIVKYKNISIYMNER